jgi:hypothetical protein
MRNGAITFSDLVGIDTVEERAPSRVIVVRS